LLLQENHNSSTIGFKYIKNKHDSFNKGLKLQFSNMLVHNEFVPGTIFLIKKESMNKVLNFLQDNYKTVITQNMYDSNSLNRDYSYVHFMERLFGFV